LKFPSRQSFIKTIWIGIKSFIEEKDIFLCFWSPLKASLSSSQVFQNWNQVFRWRKRIISKFLKSPSNQSFIKSSSLSELESSLSLKKKKVFWRFEVHFKQVFHQVIKSFWIGIMSYVEETNVFKARFYTKSFVCNQLICQEPADIWLYIGIKSFVEEIKSLSELLNLSSK